MITIKADFTKTIKRLNNIERKQIPFAASQAINDVSEKATGQLRRGAEQHLDRPTPFTLRGFRVQRSNKHNLRAFVYIAPIQDAYLKYQVKGGTRTSRAIAVPVEIKLNKYGNIPGKKSGLARGAHQFIGTFNGVKGVYERGHFSKKGKFTKSKKRRSTAIRLLVAFNKRVEYKPIFPFHKIATGVTRNTIEKAFQRRLAKALLTAR